MVQNELGYKCHYSIPDYLQRAGKHLCSKLDIEIANAVGKAAVEFWVAVVKRGQVLFEVGGVEKEDAKESMRLASHKLPIPTKIVQRDRFDVS